MNYSEYLSDVLIIENKGRNPMCFIVDNLPKRFLYQRTKKLMPMQEYSERMVPAFTVNEHGKHVPTGEMEDTLQPGVEMSQAGDGAYLFFPIQSAESRNRLQMIDEFIKQHVPDPEKRKRVHYAAQPNLLTSHPVARHQIPHVVLPAPSPTVVPPTAEAVADVNLEQEGKRQATLDRLAKARAAKKDKQKA